MHVGVYPGTFDPITNGHIDIIQRAAETLVDKLIVGVAVETGKNTLFDLDTRMDMVIKDIALLPQNLQNKIQILPMEGLLIDFVKKQDAHIIVRGLRALSDFEYEFQMAGMNKRLQGDIETVFLMASERSHFISSRFVKEIARLKGDVASFVSKNVHQNLLSANKNNGE